MSFRRFFWTSRYREISDNQRPLHSPRNLLRDANTTREDKERRLQEWYEEADALVVAQIMVNLKNG